MLKGCTKENTAMSWICLEYNELWFKTKFQIYLSIWHGRNPKIWNLVQIYLPIGELGNWDFGDSLTSTASSNWGCIPRHEQGQKKSQNRLKQWL